MSLSATCRCLQHVVVCNMSLSATSRCLQHLVVCNISLSATSRCLQHLVVCNISLSATSRCLQHLVVCNISLSAINISSFYFIYILISRCERLVRSDHCQVRSINQHQLVLLYSYTNFTMRTTCQIRSDQIWSDQSINVSLFYSIHILIPRCERLIRSGQIRSDQINQSTSARFILLTY
jgi:hypothetical protein